MLCDLHGLQDGSTALCLQKDRKEEGMNLTFSVSQFLRNIGETICRFFFIKKDRPQDLFIRPSIK